MSRVTAIISALVICIIVCLSWAVNHYRDNAITYKAQRDKCQRTGSWRTRQLPTCRCVSVMLLRSMQNTRRELADAKVENDALRDDVVMVVASVAHQQSVSQCVKPLAASGVDNAASRLADTAERIISPSERGRSLCNWKEPSILMSSADRVAHIDGQLMQLL